MKKILVLFKTHLDVGYTDFSENVIRRYNEEYIPRAIRVGRQLKAMGVQEGFVWSTGSWLIDQYLRTQDEAHVQEMEEAIRDGLIRWHGLPFTTHSEAMNKALFEYGLSISQRLDERFGMHTTGAKMTDVPGHTIAIVPLLARAGIRMLHIGVNAASTPPEVPDYFRWRAPDGSEIAVVYSKGCYGDFSVIPGTETGVLFAHTNDNMGPQSPEEILKVYRKLHEDYPEAEVESVDMSRFADEVTAVWDSLPVVTQEIGDTWIHGIASAPAKVRKYRAALCVADQLNEADRRTLFDRLLMIPEHTWGLCGQRFLHDHEHYDRAGFEAVRDQENYRMMEKSWDEQRGYLSPSPFDMSNEGRGIVFDWMDFTHIYCINPLPVSRDNDGYIQMGKWRFTLDETGAVTDLSHDGRALFGVGGHMGRFLYEHFSHREVEAFRSRYDRIDVEWSREDFGKPGLEALDETYGCEKPLFHEVSVLGNYVFVNLFMYPNERYGWPKLLEMVIMADEERLHFSMKYFMKPAVRIPEGLWVSLCPGKGGAKLQALQKLDTWIDPMDVVSCGARENHCVDRLVRFDRFDVEILDCPVISLGRPSLFAFYNELPDREGGLYMNMFNNMWSTNFPLWSTDETGICRWDIICR